MDSTKSKVWWPNGKRPSNERELFEYVEGRMNWIERRIDYLQQGCIAVEPTNDDLINDNGGFTVHRPLTSDEIEKREKEERKAKRKERKEKRAKSKANNM